MAAGLGKEGLGHDMGLRGSFKGDIKVIQGHIGI